MTATLTVPDLGDFVSSITPSDDTTARDVEILKREIEDFLAELRRRLVADLQSICDNCCPGSP